MRLHIPYYTEKPEPDEAQCALAWYTGAFADRERQLGVEVHAGRPAGQRPGSPLKAALLEEKLGADVDVGFDDSTLQPTLELVPRGGPPRRRQGNSLPLCGMLWTASSKRASPKSC